MYLLTIYFRGPRTQWAGKVCPEETIVSKPVPCLWLARIRARQLLADMVKENVGYVIMDALGNVIEPVESAPVDIPAKRSTIHGWPAHLKD